MNGYARTQRETLSGRALEREVFIRITARLAAADPRQPGGLTALADAVLENRKLWTTLAIDLATSGNTCPDALRASLLSIAAFIERHTTKVINQEASVDVLVDINRNIIRGLSAATDVEAA